MAKILVVDDEPNIRAIIRKYGEYEGHTIVEAEDGVKAVEACTYEDFDAVIMDVMMPHMDGIAALKQIRKVKKMPVIMLSAKGEEYDRLLAFDTGVDDYVVKPFSPRELMMRIRVITKRSQAEAAAAPAPEDSDHEVYRFRGIALDRSSRTLKDDAEEKNLTYKEYELFSYLIANKGYALSRDQLLTRIWGYDYYGDDRTLDTHIKMLRSSLGPYRNLITTLRGVGYRYDEKQQQ